MSETKRKSMNHPQLIRISKIHRMILSGKFPNSNELAKELETSVVTISRDIEFMRDSMMAPIAYDSSNRGYYYYEKYDMPNYCLSDRDVEVLASEKILLSHFRDTPLYGEAKNIIELLSQSVIKNYEPDYINRIAVPARPKMKYDKLIWNTLWEAIKENRIVEFDYTGRWNSETLHRRVRPYQLLIDEGIFLFGFSEERNDERLFSITRIKNLVVTEDSFEPPENISFESRCGGGKFGAFFSNENHEFKIEFYGDARSLIRDMVLADDEKMEEDDKRGATVVTFSSTQYYKIEEWLMTFGHNARPISPDWFVEDWKWEIDEMKKLSEQ